MREVIDDTRVLSPLQTTQRPHLIARPPPVLHFRHNSMFFLKQTFQDNTEKNSFKKN